MKIFKDEITFKIEDDLSSIIKTLKNVDKSISIEIMDNSFYAVEKSGYFMKSEIKDYKFIGKLSTLSPYITELKLKIALSKIGKINISIIGFFILYGLAVSLFSLYKGEIMKFLVVMPLLVGLGYYSYFRMNIGAFSAAFLLLDKMNFPMDKMETKNYS